MESQAIIVRVTGNKRCRLVMLDKGEGMIELLYYQPHRLQVGYGLEYQSTKKHSIPYLKDYSISYVPEYLIATSILFLHHILELLYYFVPIGSCTQYLFEFITEFYSYNEKYGTMDTDHKRFFLIKFFYLIGIHEKGDPSLERLLHDLASTPIDRFNNKILDLAERKRIDFWLHQCTQSHPASKLFITRNILKND